MESVRWEVALPCDLRGLGPRSQCTQGRERPSARPSAPSRRSASADVAAVGNPGFVRLKFVRLKSVRLKRVESQDFVFANEGAELQGTLSLTYGSQPSPAVVVAHGAQAGSRDYFLYRHLAQLLVTSGIGTLRFDRRGEGASTGDPDTSFDQLARDVSAALAALTEHPRIDPTRLGIWGFSQGGWISVLSATSGPPVAALALVSSTPVTPATQMTHAVTEILRRRGYGDAAVERALGIRAAVERYAKGELTAQLVKPVVDQARDEPWFDDAWIPDLEGMDWRDMDLDITPLIHEIQAPTLLIFGALDPWIPVHESIAIWEASASSLDLAVEIIAGAGHEMVPGDPLAIPATGQPAHAYEQTLITWVRRALGDRRASEGRIE